MKKEVLNVRMPSELKQKLKNISKQQGISINALIVQMLWKIN